MMRARVLIVAIVVLFGAAPRAGAQVLVSSCLLRSGSGSPEGSVVGNVCDTYFNTANGDIYTKQSGTSTTGWTVVPRLAATNTWTATNKWTVLQSINANAASLPSPLAGTLLQIGNADGTATRLELAGFASNGQFVMRRANTTAAAPSAVQSGDALGGIGVVGYGATGYSSGLRARIDFFATQNWTDTAQGTYIGFNTTANGGTTLTERVRIQNSGGVSIGTVATDPGANNLGITGDVKAFTGYTSSIGALTTKFLALYAAELWVETLVAQNTLATIGGRIIVAPTTFLTADLAPAATTITVKHNNLANGDRIVLQANSALEWMAVTSGAGGSAGAYTYTVTRNLDGSGADTWSSGDAIVDTGTTGNGFIDLYSVSGISTGTTGPTIVGNVRTGTTYSNVAARWAIGNLDGLFNYSGTTYGAAFGDASATNVTIDATNGFRIRNSTTDKFKADTSGNLSLTGDLAMSTAGVFRAGATAFGTATGWWLDYNGGTPRFRVGNPSGNQVSWDGTDIAIQALNLTVNGNGVAVADDTSGTYTVAHGYALTSSTVPGSTYGFFGYSNVSTTRDIAVVNETTDANDTATARLRAHSNTRTAIIALDVPGSGVSLGSPYYGITLTSWAGGPIGIMSDTEFVGAGILVGSATGGQKGTGNINVSGDVYKNNSAYTNPRWALQRYFTGTADTSGPYKVPEWYRGLMSLDAHRAFVATNFDLPLMLQEREAGFFGRGDLLLASVEEAYLYIYQLNDRIAALEQKLAAKEGK